MKRLIGFALFFIAIGIILGMIIKNVFIEVTIIILCLLMGYHLFCCE